MNSTSFTSIVSDKLANIDTSSTAHLTLNAASARPTRSARDSSNSDSDPDRSPSVKVLSTASGTSAANNSHPHHHPLHHLQHSLGRPSQLITGGFSLSGKHQRALWSRASSFEKLLMVAVLILGTATVLLLIALVSVFMSQKQHHQVHQADEALFVLGLGNGNTSAPANAIGCRQQQVAVAKSNSSMVPLPSTTLETKGVNQSRNYCLTPDCVKVAASVIGAIDLTVDPCDDFYVSL